ncbi:replication factor C, subunit 1 [Trypanosoma conorhini]|uniref:Replication factor C, subunit 1 n=1 Tax=Trypanosoma conorhini TaxID=83891 RepID=A0A422NZV8_9TRYP|nr:replication factor C, subunit 1 [Trypanosoma conorhini]RNF11010.1 replication factor C, subunit 1 [Trypanosoma conorhini]
MGASRPKWLKRAATIIGVGGGNFDAMVAAVSAASVGQSWAEKYKPATIAQMCYPAAANKLKAWVEAFDADGAKRRGALLSGPPGVGKTTSVYVVARALGRVVVEYNASDFRSGKSLREHVTVAINNHAFNANASAYAKILLLMDEVDGCDVGGVKEIIEMIKTTKIPIVCTCNDRWHQKLRSLMNYVEDIRVTRPPCNIVANYLCDKVLAREGISLSKQLLQDVIQRSGSDIRSMLNNLQVWCLDRTSLEQKALAACAVQSAKDSDVGLFEAAEKFLLQGTSRGRPHSIEELQTTFYNSDLVDLFVQENYIHFNPEGRDWMEAVARRRLHLACRRRATRHVLWAELVRFACPCAALQHCALCLYPRPLRVFSLRAAGFV